MSDDSNKWWNTSAGLQEKFPTLIRSPDWVKFSEIYDRPEHREARSSDYATATPSFFLSPRVFQLRDLAERTLGSESGLSSARNLSPEAAGKKLAEETLRMLSDAGTSADDIAKDLRKTQKAIDPPFRNGRDVIVALTRFIERENQLPTKKSLNIEAMRLVRLVSMHNSNSGGEFGRAVQIGSSVFIIYGDGWACPKVDWNEPRWDISEYSKLLKRCGLSGLGGAKTHPNDKKPR
ncbi:MAG: hypothetical protein H7A48_04140 [Akkermansiaceae bacterium]|nr:hypothetical protein [Akkermansiaceae bacterium]